MPILLTTGCLTTWSAGDSGSKQRAQTVSPERSYDNPDVPLTQAERADIKTLCAVVAGCDRSRCSASEERRIYKAASLDTNWGDLMRDNLLADGRAAFGKRLARLLKHEDLKWAGRDCRAVLNRHARNQF